MKRKRNKYTGVFKAKVGMDAVLGIKTVAQISREYKVNPAQVTLWKKVIRDRLPELFEPAGKTSDRSDELIAQLHQKIGELTVDLDWIKKKSKQLDL
jgi:transposase-like protein